MTGWDSNVSEHESGRLGWQGWHGKVGIGEVGIGNVGIGKVGWAGRQKGNIMQQHEWLGVVDIEK